MTIRLQGRFEITSSSIPSPQDGLRAIVEGRFVDPSGRFLANNVQAGDHVFAASPAGGVFQWRIESITTATLTDLSLQLVFDQPDAEYPVAADQVPILISDGSITSPQVEGGPATVPSQSVNQVSESLVQSVNTISDNANAERIAQSQTSIADAVQRLNDLEQDTVERSEIDLITASLLSFEAHFTATNPHNITPELLNVYTVSQVDSLIQDAVTEAVSRAVAQSTVTAAANGEFVFDGQAESPILLIFDGQAA